MSAFERSPYIPRYIDVVAQGTPLDLQDIHRVAEPDVLDDHLAAVRSRFAAKDVYGLLDHLLRYF